MSLQDGLVPPLNTLSVSEKADDGLHDVNLSDLAIDISRGNDLALFWQVLRDLWDPTTNPDGYVSLGAAENSLSHDTFLDYIKSNFDLAKASLTYGEGGIGSSRLRNALAHFLNRRLKPRIPIQKEHLVVTNGCSTAIEQCTFMLANPGDGILLGQPYYGTFIADVEMRPRAKIIRVAFGDIDHMSVDTAKCYEKALIESESSGAKVKALILCNPHNPLGRCYPRETIVALMRLCQRHKLHFISDEIYAFSVFDNQEDKFPPPVDFVSALSLDLTDIIESHLVHVIWGMSKDFGANGLRVGSIISQSNSQFHQALSIVSIYSYSSGMLDETLIKLFEDDDFTDKYIADNHKKLSKHYSMVVRFCRKHDIEYAPGVNAAFFLWVDLGKAYTKRHPEEKVEDITATVMEKLLANKVFLANGTAFGSEKPGWFRIVFSQEENYLMEGLHRVLMAIR